MDDKEKKPPFGTVPNGEISITVQTDLEKNLNPASGKNDENMELVPALTLSNVVVFPFALSPLVLTEETAIRTAEKSVGEERLIAFFPEMPAASEGLRPPVADGIEFKVPVWTLNGKTVSTIGVLVRIVKMLKFPDGTVRVLVRGLSRVRIVNLAQTRGEQTAMVRKIQSRIENNLETVAMIRNATKQFQEIISFSPNFPEELKIAILNLTDNERIADLIADTLNFSYAEKLAILTMENFQERLHLLTILLNREVEVLRLGSEIQTQVHNVMSKSQREFFLREQLKQIKEELGEGNRNPDVVSIQERMEKLTLPDTVKQIIAKEIERLDMMPQAAPEYNISYTYVDWLLSVPWSQRTEDRLDVREAARILDHDHYGLKDVKERILEFLSILQLKKDRKAPILCFIGPPGVGKTSLGKSIAGAMGRKFVRISLGGIRDEAEIRGHRRTYIGALPGRIIQGMKKAGSANPVFMLDELDKLGSDYRGDPSAALLEVLDPQQNSTFNDHYLEVDYDLSSVMFIATANIEDTIPGPLRDRMEIIRLPGYTEFEKHEIAKRYLIPRQMLENGLKANDVRFTRKAVDFLIEHYTMEAGVRGLERAAGKLCRRVAREIVEGTLAAGSEKRLDPSAVRKLMGPEQFTQEESDFAPKIGIVTGMAWTSVGGTTLEVEATKMPGKGELRLTGSLGNVMKESAMAAFSYVKSESHALGIKPSVFEKNDFHIHVPDGATPKDGPSAGVTMVTALVSLLTGRAVRPRLSMTGEITLRGRVTAIGGLREKVIAALRAGMYDIALPRENQKDLEDIPEEVQHCLRFHFFSRVPELLAFAVPEKLPEDIVCPCAEKSTEDEVYELSLPEQEPDKQTAAPASEKPSDPVKSSEESIPSSSDSPSDSPSETDQKPADETKAGTPDGGASEIPSVSEKEIPAETDVASSDKKIKKDLSISIDALPANPGPTLTPRRKKTVRKTKTAETAKTEPHSAKGKRSAKPSKEDGTLAPAAPSARKAPGKKTAAIAPVSSVSKKRVRVRPAVKSEKDKSASKRKKEKES